MNNSKTTAYLMESIFAQTEILSKMNPDQLEAEAKRIAERRLKRMIRKEKRSGNLRLTVIYSGLLDDLRRGDI
jgi:hypothetical protein